MEQNIKEKALMFTKGVTNAQSDLTNGDDELVECVGMTYQNGSLVPIQKPKLEINTRTTSNLGDGSYIDYRLLYVHNNNGWCHYIFSIDGCTLYYLNKNLNNNKFYGNDGNVVSEDNITTYFVIDDENGWDIRKIVSIGNTLIVSTDNGIMYYLWKTDSYICLGSQLPDIDMNFKITNVSTFGGKRTLYYMDNLIRKFGRGFHSNYITAYKDGKRCYDIVSDGSLVEKRGADFIIKNMCVAIQDDTKDKYQTFQDTCIAAYTERLNEMKKLKKFTSPFWIRFAYRLYDGTYTKMSQPILIMPSVRRNGSFTPTKYTYGEDRSYIEVDPDDFYPRCRCYTGAVPAGNNLDEFTNLDWAMEIAGGDLELICGNFNSIGDNWQDIIKGVDIFMSEEVQTFDMNKEWVIVNPGGQKESTFQQVGGTTFTDKRFDSIGIIDYKLCGYNEITNNISGSRYPTYLNSDFDDSTAKITIDSDNNAIVAQPWKFCAHARVCDSAQYSDDEIRDKLLEKSVFYKIKSFDLDELKTMSNTTAKLEIDDYILENLTEQKTLDDDYFSNTQIIPSLIEVYNNRLNIANYVRKPCNAFTNFLYYNRLIEKVTVFPFYRDGATWDIYVYIKARNCIEIVHSTMLLVEYVGVWFFYPDPRAYKVLFINRTDEFKSFELKLKEHDKLNGAYYFGDLPSLSNEYNYTGQYTYQTLPKESTEVETIQNEILVSSVDNPFSYKASNSVTIGDGIILGIKPNTKGLSQGTFGTHPMLAFATDGIWALSVSSEGVYNSSVPMPREICNNAETISLIDDYIIFSSSNGLKVVDGRDVTSISPQLSGRSRDIRDTFGAKFNLENFNEFIKNCNCAYDYKKGRMWLVNPNENYAWILNLNSKTYSIYPLESTIQRVVNNYPDNLIQDGRCNVYSLMNTVNEDEDIKDYEGEFISRPIKFSDSLTMKSLRKIKSLYSISSENGKFGITIYGSNDMKHWTKILSLKGKPWKYFTIKYNMSGMKAIDEFDGTVVVIQNKRTNKLR